MLMQSLSLGISRRMSITMNVKGCCLLLLVLTFTCSAQNEYEQANHNQVSCFSFVYLAARLNDCTDGAVSELVKTEMRDFLWQVMSDIRQLLSAQFGANDSDRGVPSLIASQQLMRRMMGRFKEQQLPPRAQPLKWPSRKATNEVTRVAPTTSQLPLHTQQLPVQPNRNVDSEFRHRFLRLLDCWLHCSIYRYIDTAVSLNVSRQLLKPIIAQNDVEIKRQRRVLW